MVNDNVDNLERNTGEEENLAKRKIEEFKQASIDYYNFEEHAEKVLNTVEIIETQKSNIMSKFSHKKQKYASLRKNPKIKEIVKEHEVAPGILYFTLEDMYYMLQEYSLWSTYKSEIYDVVFPKYVKILKTVKAMDIQREVLKESRQIFDENRKANKEVMVDFQKAQERRYDVHKESVNNMLLSIQERVYDKVCGSLNKFSDVLTAYIEANGLEVKKSSSVWPGDLKPESSEEKTVLAEPAKVEPEKKEEEKEEKNDIMNQSIIKDKEEYLDN